MSIWPHRWQPSGQTTDPSGAVKLINGNVECTSCHNPHVQGMDPVSLNFLVLNSSNGQTVPGLPRSDAADERAGESAGGLGHQRACSFHGQDRAAGQRGELCHGGHGGCCIGCHAPHNANGTSRLLRGQNEQDCIACHNGANVSPMPTYANVFAEYATPKVGHPFPTSTNPHDAAESVLLNNNRHATCVDCHNAHGSEVGRRISRRRR